MSSGFHPGKGLTIGQCAGVFVLLFAICGGLGYPILNRYDPTRTDGTKDSANYAHVIREGHGGEHHRNYRVLQAWVSRPIYLLARHRSGPWSPMGVALLFGSCVFMAMAGTLTVSLAMRTQASGAGALLAVLLLLCNFWVPNNHLAGMVDAGEMFALLLVAWALSRQRWWLLPLIGIIGALAKETSIIMGAAMCIGWWVIDRRAMCWVWIAGFVLAGLLTMMALRFEALGEVVWPWNFAADKRSHDALSVDLVSMFSEPGFWYGWVWLLPLGIWRLGRLPRAWVLGSLAAALAALAMALWHGAGGGGAARPMLNAAGPVLSVSAAMCLLQWFPAVRTT
jgi:hypothetical protein